MHSFFYLGQLVVNNLEVVSFQPFRLGRRATLCTVAGHTSGAETPVTSQSPWHRRSCASAPRSISNLFFLGSVKKKKLF